VSTALYVGVGVIALLNGAVAAWCARSRAFFIYVGIIGLGALAAFLCLTVPTYGHTTRGRVMANLLWAVPIPGVFGVSPGLLIRRGSHWAWTLLAGIATTLIATPIFLIYGLALICGLTGDCL
jgi:hypothetical protein